jgi:hypothetical protein
MGTALPHLIPEIWSADVLERLNDKLVYGKVCNRGYESQVRAFGDVIKINEIGTVNVNSYTSTSTTALTIQQLTDAQQSLRIDRAKYTSFWLDKLERAQITPDVLEPYKEESAWKLANEIDEYIAGLHGQAGITVTGTSASGTDVTSTNTLKYLSLIAQKHDEANTPAMGRWIVVPPWFYQKMLMAKIVLDTSNSGLIASGALGSFMGFAIYTSNNVEHQSGTDRASIMSGYRDSIALAQQVAITEVHESQTIGFKWLVKSLMVYGAKVIRGNQLAVAWLDYVAEAT